MRASAPLAKISDWARGERALTELGARVSRAYGAVTLVGSGLHEDPAVLAGAMADARACGADVKCVAAGGFAVTLTVATVNVNRNTGQVEQETKALLNVSPRNVFNVWELASLGITNRVQPMPPSIAVLLP